jgi:Protein of unknown function (DUF3987)
LRQAYDSGSLRTLTKNSPLRATGAHVSLVGHITEEELRTALTATEQSNGFANRFLFFLVQRSKRLPDPQPVPYRQLSELAADLQSVLRFAREVGRVQRDPEASALWHQEYDALSEERPGLLGSVTARAEAHTLRLSLLYALLDEQASIGVRHLQAALGVWRYAEESARRIFGTKTGDPIADRIEAALRARGPMTRTEIRDLFQRNVEAERIGLALDVLILAGRATWHMRTTPGRPAEVWEAVS